MDNIIKGLQRRAAGFHPAWMKEAFLCLFSTRMSATAFHLDYFVFPPIAIVSLWLALVHLSLPAVVMLFSVGLLAWTLAEYLLHRFALHQWPYFSAYHLAHHENPRAMIASPTLFTIIFFGIGFLLPLWIAIGRPDALATFSGFVTGYLAFAAVHQAVHHSNWQSPLMRHFKRLHAIHHHGQADKNFGVLTNFWDRVFGTYSNVMRNR